MASSDSSGDVFDPAWLEPDEGWVTVGSRPSPGDTAFFVTETPWSSTGSGASDAERLGLAFRSYRRLEDDHLVGKAWFGSLTQGPPGHVHGGALLAVVDHALGAAAMLSGYPSFTARIEYDFRSMVPLFSQLRVDAWVGEVRGRKVTTHARLETREGDIVGEAKGLFVLMPEKVARQIKQRHRARMRQTDS